MGDTLFITVVCNSLLFSFIFWALTFLAKKFYSNKYSNEKLSFYECGFKSVTNLKLTIGLQYTLLAAFLIIYDSEFLLLFPLAFNSYGLQFNQLVLFLVFVMFIVFALLVDYVLAALDWNI